MNSAVRLSVVIPTYNRPEAILRILQDLARQSLAPNSFEVIVVDDGSVSPIRPIIQKFTFPYQLFVLEQLNAGPATARHRGILHSSGEITVAVDDDMLLPTGFLEAHDAAHPVGSRRVALGPFYNEESRRLPLHQRMGSRSVIHTMNAARDEQRRIAGSRMYTGNVSFRRSDYVQVDGFDPAFRISEDAELGIRLAQSGVVLTFAKDAHSVHATIPVALHDWMQLAVAYGRADTRVAAKHPRDRDASPWRFLSYVRVISRPFLLLSALTPSAMRSVTWLAFKAAHAADRLRLDCIALAGVTFAYGLLYFRGVREQSGSRRDAMRGLRRYLNNVDGTEIDLFARYAKSWADVASDHEAIRQITRKYKGADAPTGRLPSDLVQRIGFQMMALYRLMRFFRTSGLTLFAKLTSRLLRHLYAADLHWDAELAPGVIVVHGMGLVIAAHTRVGTGCVLFQNVTLGENIHPETRETGVPTLENDVHVGPGATLLGPITIGAGTKIMAGALVRHSVPAGSLVEVPIPNVRPRSGHSA